MTINSFLIIMGSVLLTTAAQISLKIASGRFNLDNNKLSFVGSLISQLLDPLTICAIIAYVGSLVLWLLALRNIPLSIAYAFSGLTLALVTLSSVVFLNENVTLLQLMGIVLIIAGIILITRV